MINATKTISLSSKDDLVSLEKICTHLKEKLNLIIDGPKRRKNSKFFDVTIKRDRDSNGSRWVEISFDSGNYRTIVSYHHIINGTLCGSLYNLKNFDDLMLAKIEAQTSEWIYDVALPTS